MKKRTRQLRVLTSTLLLSISYFLMLGETDPFQSDNLSISIRKAEKLRLQNPDSSIQLLQKYYLRATEIADTSLSIEALKSLSEVYGHQAKYKEAYDFLWTALLLADAANMELRKAQIYRSLGRHYSFYKRRANSMKFLNRSLEIKKDLVKRGEIDEARLAEDYRALCATFRELDEIELCKAYLDSSFLYHSPKRSRIHLSYLKFEKAVLLSKKQQYQEAISIFLSIIPWFSEQNPGYQVLVYYYLGETYRKLGEYTDSKRCYETALDISARYHSHIDFSPLVYEKLSELYLAMGNLEGAYRNLKIVKELDQQFFDSRSPNNRPLLEIQDAFRKEKETQKKILQEQRLTQLEQEDKILLLQRTILIGSLVFLLLMGFMYVRDVRAKHQAEKLLIAKQQELEIQKAHEIVELKNKELAASTLKLIGKEASIDSLKDRLLAKEGNVSRKEIQQIVHSISHNNADNWKEFETRFVAVNDNFYAKLTQEFPKLTQGDLKLCALVKLNFSSKEMAKLLGISVESVHTTRYRLRKKLSLSRDMNLKEFIANF